MACSPKISLAARGQSVLRKGSLESWLHRSAVLRVSGTAFKCHSEVNNLEKNKGRKANCFAVQNDVKINKEITQNGLMPANNSICPSILSTAKDASSQTFLYGKFNGGNSAGKF